MYYLLVILIFALDVYVIYIGPFIDKIRKEKYQEKILASKTTINSENGTIIYETYPNKILVGFNGEYIEADSDFVNIKENSCCKSLVLRNVKKIIAFDVSVDEIRFINSSYKEENGIIYDCKGTACFFIKRFKIKDLIKVHRIERTLLNKMSNSTYFQFIPSKGSLRISAPYNEDERRVRAIIPDSVDGIDIETVEINCKKIDFIYLGKNVKRVILERKIDFNRVKVDCSNEYLKVRNSKLVYRIYNTYVSLYTNKSNVKDSTKFAYIPPIRLSKKGERCRKYHID